MLDEKTKIETKIETEIEPKSPIIQKKNGKNKVMILSTKSGEYFADLLLEKLGTDNFERVAMDRKQFAGGEEYYRVNVDKKSDLLDKTVIFVSSTAYDSDFLELVRVGMALSAYGTRRRIFVIPFMGYSTMERATKSGEVVTCKTNCRILSSIPKDGEGNIFFLFDLHVSGIVHYFESTIAFEVYGEQILAEGVRKLNLEPGTFMFASADLGRTAWVSSYSKKFNNTPVAFVRKTRKMEETEVHEVIGEVKGMHVIIYDDMIRSGGTLFHAVDAYLNNGALSIYTVISHFAITSEAVCQKLVDSKITKIITTNSHPMSQIKLVKESDKFIIVDASIPFAKAIRNYF
eukprot:Anaeramoba_ignava/a483642_45.p1 GENE.a483642_45~~a483642_45.p1  ORF type:complete len:346 (-),score=115.92 a483642_45:26-1063(-)